jgi:hydrogenase assembly chaperone HypC/HupF
MIGRDRCVTCSDEAVPATVVAVEGPNATVEAQGSLERVGIELVEDVRPGDIVLCHAGIALEKVQP